MAELNDDIEEQADEPIERRPWLENKLVLLGAIVAVQIVMAVVLTRFVIAPKLAVQAADVGGAVPTAQVPDVGVIIGLQEIIVTLQSEGKLPRYLRIDVNLEVADQKTAKLVTARLPQLRDVVIMAASARSPADIQSPEGKQGLREEIFNQLATKLPPDKFRNVYFSDLVIQ